MAWKTSRSRRALQFYNFSPDKPSHKPSVAVSAQSLSVSQPITLLPSTSANWCC